MGFQYVSVKEAIARPGLRMVVVGNIPSPWGEAAKGILHVKSIDWVAVRLVYDDDRLLRWAGERSAPVAIYNNEKPLNGWSDILRLAERLAPTPSLLPKDPVERVLAFGLAHELMAEGGLAWSRRIELVHAGLQNKGGFPERTSKYLARKYGYSPDAGATAAAHVVELLHMLSARLKAQQQVGSPYYVGQILSAVDIYSAAVMAMFAPLPEPQCSMDESVRRAFVLREGDTAAALDAALLDHREMIYSKHLQLPLAL